MKERINSFTISYISTSFYFYGLITVGFPKSVKWYLSLVLYRNLMGLVKLVGPRVMVLDSHAWTHYEDKMICFTT